MPGFMDEHFLLDTGTGRALYHDCAASLPIIDYHSHLPVDEIASRKRFADIAELWLGGDHYKWRLMRSAGIEEPLITGDADPRDKFLAYCRVLPQAIGNPIYHWSHLELRRLFQDDRLINAENAPALWHDLNQALKHVDAWSLLEQSRVEIACTTDEASDSLAGHQTIRQSPLKTRVLPAFRPDRAMRINHTGFTDYLLELARCVDREINNFSQLVEALALRMDYFHALGARLSDHAVDLPLATEPVSLSCLERLFAHRLVGQMLDQTEQIAYQSGLLHHLAQHYQRLQWTWCLHIGAQRNNNQRMLVRLGPDTGYDSISDQRYSRGLATLMDGLDAIGALPKTMLFCLDPSIMPVLSSLMGCFQDGSVCGKIQLGPAWWFNDHYDGNLQQLRLLASHGVLGSFVGMVTDSRSFASYPRHDYFRRLLCRQLGQWVEAGEYPADETSLHKLVSAVCYQNAKNYFGF